MNVSSSFFSLSSKGFKCVVPSRARPDGGVQCAPHWSAALLSSMPRSQIASKAYIAVPNSKIFSIWTRSQKDRPCYTMPLRYCTECF